MIDAPRSSGGWRSPILAHFSPEIAAVARLTIVADPDGLLTEPGVVEGILSQGFEIIPFDDPIAFRFAYERRFRANWDRGAETNLVVVLRANRSDPSGLPYDLLEQAKRDRRLYSFSLGDLFPNLAPHVLAELDRAHLDAVHAAQELYQPEALGENATRDFLLRNVFQIDPAQIHNDVDLLRTLLRHHYAARLLPGSLSQRLIRLLRNNPYFQEWPLELIVPSRAKFLEFLQERWPVFLQRYLTSVSNTAKSGFREEREPYGLRHSGPAVLPFDHEDVRVYMDNFFTDGLLTPAPAIPRAAVDGTWMAAGVAGETKADRAERLRKLLHLHEAHEPGDNSDHQLWIQAAMRWAEAVAIRWSLGPDLDDSVQARFAAARDRIQQRFQSWLLSHYTSLHSLSFLPRPVMVHQVPKYVAHRAVSMNWRRRMAVLVVDGLALDQWSIIREQITDVCEGGMEESGAFAWIPTLTSVSRQSIFAGDPPFFFGSSLDTTRKEEHLWKRFWEDQGVARDGAHYICQGSQEDDQAFIGRVQVKIDNQRCRVLGIVVGTIDQMLHGIVTGTDGLHAGIRHWGQRGALRNLIEVLADAGFDIVLTSDHGNVEGIGIGKPNVGVTAESRGERAHVFRDGTLRARTEKEYPGSIPWPNVGLPDEYFALISPAGSAFIQAGRRTIAHGGICLEEVIVPLITIAKPE